MSEYELSPMGEIAKFHDEHGRHVLVEHGRWILFEDGATRENEVYGAMIPVPDDPIERAKNIEQYHRTLLDRATPQFDDRKRAILAQLGAYDTTFDDEDSEKILAELKGLQDSCLELKRNHEQALEALRLAKGETTENRHRHDEFDEYLSNIKADLLRKVSKIVI